MVVELSVRDHSKLLACRRRLRILARRLKPIYSDNALTEYAGSARVAAW